MKSKKERGKEKMRAEYDFVKAKRGKFYRLLSKGYIVHIKQNDGTEVIKHYLKPGDCHLADDCHLFH